MIAKITSGSSFYGVLSYCESKHDVISKEGEEATDLKGFERLVVMNFDSGQHIFSNKNELSTALGDWTNRCKKIEKGVFHASMALPPGEHLSNEILTKVAARYLQEMGYGNNPYVIYRHNDTHHSHVHIVTSRVGEGGKKISDKFERKKNVDICRKLEKEFGLKEISSVKSNIEPGATFGNDQEYNPHHSFKNHITLNLDYQLRIKKVTSFDSLSQELLKKGIKMVWAKEDGSRLPKNGVLFYRLDPGGRAISRLKGSAFGKEFGLQIEKRFEHNKIPLSKQIEDNVLRTSDIQFSKPTAEEYRLVSKGLYNAYNELLDKGVYDSRDIKETFAKNKLIAIVQINKAGLNGIVIHYQDKFFKASDFSYLNAYLSSTVLKPGFVFGNTSKNEQFIKKVDYLIDDLKKNRSDGASTKDLVFYLNRNGISVWPEGNGFRLEVIQNKLVNATLKEFYLINKGLSKSEFTQGDQYNLSNFGRLTTSLELRDLVSYKAMLSGEEKAIKSNSKFAHSQDIYLGSGEDEMLNGRGAFEQYCYLQERIHNADLSYKRIKGNSLLQIIRELNIRGLEFSLDLDEKGKLKGFSVSDLNDKDLSLNGFNTVYPFSFNYINDLYSKLNDTGKAILQNNKANSMFSAELIDALNCLEKNEPISDALKRRLLSNPAFAASTKAVLRSHQEHNDEKQDERRVNTRFRHPDSPVQKARVSNNTVLNDMWDAKKGL